MNNFCLLIPISYFLQVTVTLVCQSGPLATEGDYEFTLEDEVIAYGEVKKLHAALDKLEPLEREVIEGYYILDEPLGEIACDSDKSYYQFARGKKKALQKLRSFM